VQHMHTAHCINKATNTHSKYVILIAFPRLQWYRERALSFAVSWLRRLVAGLSPRRPGFNPTTDNVGFVVDKVTVAGVFVRVLWSFPRQCHSTNAANWFIHLSPVSHNLDNRHSRQSQHASVLTTDTHCTVILTVTSKKHARFISINAKPFGNIT